LADEIAKNNALIRFYFKVDPERLSDNKWCQLVEELDFVLKYTGQLVPKDGQ
jgi:hypothetical protein